MHVLCLYLSAKGWGVMVLEKSAIIPVNFAKLLIFTVVLNRLIFVIDLKVTKLRSSKNHNIRQLRLREYHQTQPILMAVNIVIP